MKMTPTGYTMTQPVYLKRGEDIAALIKTRREALGLSQQALAERLNVSRKWVNEIEQGNANAKLGLVLRAFNELGIELCGQLPQSATSQTHPNIVDDIDIDAIADTGLHPLTKRGRR
jgi:HTH-type transcriptional regulator / antitoxin HipB